MIYIVIIHYANLCMYRIVYINYLSVFLLTLFIFVPRVVTKQVFPTPGIKDPVRPTCVMFYVTPAPNIIMISYSQKKQLNGL